MADGAQLFAGIKKYRSPLQKIFEAGTHNTIPWNERIFQCECCNDTGIVQDWKLRRFVPDVFGDGTGFDHTYPVFCRQFTTCGEYFAYIADSDEKVKGSLFQTPKREPTLIFETIRSGAHTLLNQEQSSFIQRKVLELRKEIGTRPKPIEPELGVELDGVTILTNATTPDDLPF